MNATNDNITSAVDDHKTQQILHRIVVRFRKRANVHKFISYLSLLLTIFVLSGGIYIFAVADELAATRLGAVYQQLTKSFSELLPSANRAFQSFGETADQAGKDISSVASTVSSYLKSEAASSLPEKFEKDPELRKAMLKFFSEIDTKQVNAAVKDFGVAAKEAASTAREMNEMVKKLSSQDSQVTLLAKAISTRVMAVVLSIFLVQLLVGLYRYNTRMASYYDGRADALELSQGVKKETLEVLVPILSAETIDFGKGPSSPLDRAVEVTKSFISKGH